METSKLPPSAQLSFFPTDSQMDFWKRLNAGESLDCPCCKRHAMIYTRKIHTSIALQLINLYRLGGHVAYIHTSKLIAPGSSGIGDFSKAKYWGLIEPKENTDDDKKSSGYWRLTSIGIAFVRGKQSVAGAALVFDDKVIGFTDDPTDIRAALGHKFSYDELMNG